MEELDSKRLALKDLISRYGSKALEHLSRPGASMRSGINELQKGNNPLDAIARGFNDPSSAPTGADIADASGLPDDSVLGKTAIATASEFMDPLDVVGMGTAVKGAKAISKAVRPLQMSASKSDDFLRAVNAAKKTNPKIAPAITDYTPEELSKFKTMLTPDAKSGFAVKPDGEATNLFSSVKGRGEDLMDEAISQGTKKMDHFDIDRLNELYSKKGFKEVKREPNWTKGDPDVVYREKPQGSFDKILNYLKRNM